jgi:hypothetical protein
MPQPISLSDSEMTAIMSAAKPLSPRDRDAFLQHIAVILTAMAPPRGDGAVGRAIRAAFQQHFVAPDLRVSEPRSRAY